MFKKICQLSVITLVLLSYSQLTWAAAAPVATTKTSQAVEIKKVQPTPQNLRYSLTAQKVRIVMNVTTLPTITANFSENADQLIVNFDSIINTTNTTPVVFNDPVVSGFQFSLVGTDKQQLVINLNKIVTYKVFTLANPNRVVIDIIKDADQKTEEQIAPGVKYTSFLRTMAAGRISAHILDLSPDSDYKLKPVLSNDAISGLEKLQSMVENNKAIAGINSSYFALNGEILGLLKMDGEIASTSEVDRTALGILPDGKMLMDVATYQGSISLPDGRVIAITGVNHERGTNDLILYNNYFDSTTGTNVFGTDYILSNGKIIAIAHGNAGIPPGGVVISAHGVMEKALVSLKIGDTLKINQTLGDSWDKTNYVVSAGPRLVKNGSIFLTSKEEAFPSDITVGRAPRTALGITKEGHILLFVVDGRQQSSIGMSLQELAQFMQEIGSVEAMNFDGGGSSEMVINNKILNNPSDGHERSLGAALLIVPKN